MPKRFAIRLPNHAQRLKILRLMLAHATLSPGFDFEELARRTDGLSGSDLKETCRNAAMIPVRELMREKGGKGIKGMEEAKREVGFISVLVTLFPTELMSMITLYQLQGFQLRPLKMSDFIAVDSHAYSHVDPSGSGRRYQVPGNDDPMHEPLD